MVPSIFIPFALFSIVSITLCQFQVLALQSDRKLIVISMDGLMPAEVQPDAMPFISKVYKNGGVFCPRLQPVFPTKTFVNHFSIATGLYAASHGVFDTEIYDHKSQKKIHYSPEMYMFRPNVTPIWTLNELAGGHSAVSMWSAGEFAFRGLTPTFFEPLNRNVHWKQRIDRLIPLLKRNESQINFVMFYTNHPDSESHSYSVPSKEVTEGLKDLDNMMRYLDEKLSIGGLSEATDVIILSDHGMDNYYFNSEDVDESIIDLRRIVSNDSWYMYGSSPVVQAIAHPGCNQTELCQKLKQAAKINGNYSVYTDAELNEEKAHWHVQNDRRFGVCIVVAEPGHVFHDIRTILKKYQNYDQLIYGTKFGRHGYDNRLPSMQAVFMAPGPRFRAGVEIPFLQNIDLFHLFARLLNIEQLVPGLYIDGIDRREVWSQMLK